MWSPTSMVGLRNGHIGKNLSQKRWTPEIQLGTQKKKKKKSLKIQTTTEIQSCTLALIKESWSANHSTTHRPHWVLCYLFSACAQVFKGVVTSAAVSYLAVRGFRYYRSWRIGKERGQAAREACQVLRDYLAEREQEEGQVSQSQNFIYSFIYLFMLLFMYLLIFI